MFLYYPTKFHFNAMNSFKVIGGHSPPPPSRAQASSRKIGLTSKIVHFEKKNQTVLIKY